LNYIGHTLEQYKGCDILDISPGACLWSHKLHEFLEPRSHVLLESSPELFQPFLLPLLESPGSKYKLVTKSPLEVSSYRELVDEGVFPHQVRVDPSGPKAQELNKTLLVTGSLVWDPTLPGMGFDSMAKQLYSLFASAAWSNDAFHAYGPVRTLFWVQSDDFNQMIAKTTMNFRKQNRLLEATNDMKLVVNSGRVVRQSGKAAVGRAPQYEIESTIRALRSGKKGGYEFPEHRRDASHAYATLVEQASGGSGITRNEPMLELMQAQHLDGNVPVQFSSQNLLETVELWKELQSEYTDQPLILPLPVQEKLPSKPRVDKQHPAAAKVVKYNKNRATTTQLIKIQSQIEATADIGEELYQLELKALKMKDGPKKDDVLKQINDLNKAWNEALSKIPPNYQGAPVNELDDRINLRYPPRPRIQWDSRPFDPLIAREDEVWPRNRVSLIDATPIPRPVGDDPDWHEWVIDFIHGLYQDSTKSVLVALDNMQPGLSDIVKDCPSLTNPEKGGRLQLKNFRVRLLTMEMIVELARAYKDWPFKAPGTERSLYFRHRGKTVKFGSS
jgi:transcription factor 1